MNSVSRVGIVGLGTIGAQELALWRRADLDPIGYDISEARVRAFGGPHLTTHIEDLEPAEALILCLPNLAPSGENSMEAFDHFVEAAKRLSAKDRLLVVASTVPIGFTRDLAARLGRHGRSMAHAPERFDPGRGIELGEIPRVVGGLSTEALEATMADVIDAAATKPFAFMAHQPGVGAGGTCIPTMPRYLLDAAKESSVEMPILRDAVDANDQIINRVGDHVRQLLARGGITRAKILVAGATYKPNYPDARASAALAFARGLAHQHDVVVFDPIVDPAGFPEDLPLLRELPREGRFDAVVVALKHRDTDIVALRQLSPILIDLVRGAVEATESISSLNR